MVFGRLLPVDGFRPYFPIPFDSKTRLPTYHKPAQARALIFERLDVAEHVRVQRRECFHSRLGACSGWTWKEEVEDMEEGG
jgi:hypothetical protein